MTKKGTGILSGILFLMCSVALAHFDLSFFQKQITLDEIFTQSTSFTENKGQLKHYNIDWSTCGDIKYYTRSFGGAAYFADNGIGFGFIREQLNERKHPSKHEHEHEEGEEHDENPHYTSTGFFLEFVGKNSNALLIGEGKQITKYNFYSGNSHVSDVGNYNALFYKNLYSNIDLKYYIGDGKLKFDYIIKPGADVQQIQLRYQGMQKISVNRKGELEILTPWGILIDAKPYSYQMIDGRQQVVEVRYKKLDNGNIAFEIVGNYDKSKELIIDPPVLSWASMIGGPGGNGYHYDITIDANGNHYGTGWYNNAFPMVNPVDNVAFGEEAFVYKLSADGTTLLYGTFIGGNGAGTSEVGTGIAVNTLGEVFLCGFTNNATNFPKTGTPIQNTITGGEDIFAVKLNAAGALAYSTFYGGTANDYALAIDIDAANNAFITGTTSSTAGFATAGAHQTVHGGATDAFILKINAAGTAVLFCTYIGGSGDDLGRDIVVDISGNPYIGGGTASSAGIATAGSFDNTFGGDAVDGFVAKFSSNGVRVYGAYCGGNNEDKVESVDVKCNGELVVSGYTRSYNNTFVAVNAIQANNGAAFGGPRDAFMRRVSPDGSTLLNSTFMGTSDEDATKNGVPFNMTIQQRGTAVSVNRQGNIAMVFSTISVGLPLVSPVQAAPAGGGGGLGDAYSFVTDSLGNKIIFSTYFGGSDNDYCTAGIKYHPVDDKTYTVAGSTHSPDGSFPSTPGAYMTLRQTPTASDQLYLAVYYLPVCTLKVDLPNPGPICKNDTVTFTADTICGGTAPTFQWLVNGIVQAGETGKTFSVSTLNNNDEVCVVFSKIIPGCFPAVEDDTACVTMVVNPLPVLTLADDSICKGKTTSIDAGAGFDSYLWSNGQTGSAISVSVAGSYWVEVTDNGCKNKDTMNLVERPVLFLHPDSAKTCNPGNTGYTVTFNIGGGDPASYKVTGLGGTLTGSSFTSNLINSGDPFSLIVTDSHNCDTVQFSGTLSCGCNPVVTLTSDTLICNGDSAAIVFNLSGAVPPYDVTYTDGTSNFTLNDITNGYVKYVHPAATTQYTAISITDKNGCMALSSSKMTVTVAPAFQILVTPSHISCFGLCDGSAMANTQNGDGPFTYLWSPQPPVGQGTANVSQLCSGTHKVVIADKYGCKDSVSPVLTKPQKIVYTVDSIAAHCNQSDGSASITVVSGGTAPFDYQWNAAAGNQVTPAAANLKPGMYTVVLSDNKNCTVTETIEVLNIPAPSFTPVYTNPLCYGDCSGTARLINITGGTRPFIYTWTSPAGVSAPLLNDSAASALCEGTYKVVVSDKFSCKDSATFNLSDPSPVHISISPSSATCVDGSLQLSASASGGTPGYTYSWLADPTLSNSAIANPLATPVGMKTYTVSAKDVNNCPSPSISAVLIRNPAAAFVFDTIPDCNSIAVAFTNQSTASTATHSCVWDFGNGTTSAECDPSLTLAAGTYSITLTVTDDSSCVASVTESLTLQAYPTPEPSFSASPQPTTIYDPLISFINLSTGASAFSWYFGTGDSSKLASPYYTYPDTGTYNVCLRTFNIYGCSKETCSAIRIDPEVSFFIPNAFTPNGDGVNESFKPLMTGYAYDDYEFLVFDRWGELIFSTTDINAAWDGTYKGRDVQVDVYVWKILAREQFSKDLEHRIGRVSVVR
ncbi:MAG: PKD domain-containing protein [Flavobacteriales bacterium]